MRRILVLSGFICLVNGALLIQAVNAEEETAKYALLAGKIITCASEPVDNGVILISGGKIEAIGPQKEIEIPAGYKVLDHRDMYAMPGLIEAHSHFGADSGDLNDSVYPINSGLRVLDQIQPYKYAMQLGIQSGVTTMLHIPGSGSNMAGIGAIMKCGPGTQDEVLLKFPG